MFSLKPFFSLFILFIFLQFSALAQTAFPLVPEQLPEVMAHIEAAYGDQIEIDLAEIYEFLSLAINEDNYGEECTHPDVGISEYEPDYLTFSWDTPLQDVSHYECRSLDLYTGSSEYNTTEEGNFTYEISSGFHLFLFNSVCFSGRVSRAQIIIVDKDVMLHLPPDSRNCQCQNSSTISLIKQSISFSSVLGYAQVYWPNSPCNITKYIVDINDPVTSYSASAFILHDPNTYPETVYINPACSHNFNFNPRININPGHTGQYHIEFSNKIRVNIENQSLMQNGTISLTTCQCDDDSRSEKSKPKSTPDDFTLGYQNPVYDQLSIKVTLGQASRISLQLFDLLGRPISHENIINQEVGTHQIKIPVSHLSSGIYTCLVEYNDQVKVLKIIKAK